MSIQANFHLISLYRSGSLGETNQNQTISKKKKKKEHFSINISVLWHHWVNPLNKLKWKFLLYSPWLLTQEMKNDSARKTQYHHMWSSSIFYWRCQLITQRFVTIWRTKLITKLNPSQSQTWFKTLKIIYFSFLCKVIIWGVLDYFRIHIVFSYTLDNFCHCALNSCCKLKKKKKKARVKHRHHRLEILRKRFNQLPLGIRTCMSLSWLCCRTYGWKRLGTDYLLAASTVRHWWWALVSLYQLPKLHWSRFFSML